MAAGPGEAARPPRALGGRARLNGAGADSWLLGYFSCGFICNLFVLRSRLEHGLELLIDCCQRQVTDSRACRLGKGIRMITERIGH